MSGSIPVTKNSRGRPKTGIGTQIGMRWHDDVLAQIDGWRRQQDDLPGRPEAIRRLVEQALASKHAGGSDTGATKQTGSAGRRVVEQALLGEPKAKAKRARKA